MISFLLILATAMSSPNFSGDWILEKRKNLDAYLQSRGHGIIVTKLINCTQNAMRIQQNGADFVISTTLTPCIGPSKKVVRKFKADGKTVAHGKMYNDVKVHWIAHLTDEKMKVEATTPKGTEYVTREFVDGKIIQKHWIKDKNIVMTQYFTQKLDQ